MKRTFVLLVVLFLTLANTGSATTNTRLEFFNTDGSYTDPGFSYSDASTIAESIK